MKILGRSFVLFLILIPLTLAACQPTLSKLEVGQNLVLNFLARSQKTNAYETLTLALTTLDKVDPKDLPHVWLYCGSQDIGYQRIPDVTNPEANTVIVVDFVLLEPMSKASAILQMVKLADKCETNPDWRISLVIPDGDRLVVGEIFGDGQWTCRLEAPSHDDQACSSH